jgi:hypothetical protein
VSTLGDIKADARAYLLAQIAAGKPVGGEVLPLAPLRIEIGGHSPETLQARIFYPRPEPPRFIRLAARREPDPCQVRSIHQAHCAMCDWSGDLTTDEDEAARQAGDHREHPVHRRGLAEQAGDD